MSEGPSFGRHEAIGKELYETREMLVELTRELRFAYGVGSIVEREAYRALEHVDALRSRLDRALAEEHGERFDAAVYYPGVR